MIRVLVVDDHPVLRAGLEAVLRTEPGFVCVGTAGDGHELLAALRHTRPDVVLLDWRLGHEDGVALCRTLRAETAPPEVVLYTASADSGLEAQASAAAHTPWWRRAPTSISSSTPCAWPHAAAAKRRRTRRKAASAAERSKYAVERPSSYGPMALGRWLGRRSVPCRRRVSLHGDGPAADQMDIPAACLRVDTEVFDLPYVIRPKGLRGTMAAMLAGAALLLVACRPPRPARARRADDQGVPGLRRYGRLRPAARRLVRVGRERVVADRRLGGGRQRVRGRSAVRPTPSRSTSAPPAGPSRQRSAWGRAPDVPLLRPPPQRQLGRAERQAALDGRWRYARDARRRVSGADLAWHPSKSFNLATVLGIWNDDQSVQTQFVFQPERSGAAWAIDDVYVDPYSRG